MPDNLVSAESRRIQSTNPLEAESQAQPLSATNKREWLRIPDVTRLYGVGRTSLYELIGEGKIKSASLRKRGNIRGIRLISAASLEAYLEAIATK